MRLKFSILVLFPLLLLTTLSMPKTAKAECGGPFPPAPVGVRAVSGPNAGEVTLFWNQSPHANRYAVAYGESSKNYLYGADNIGGENATSYTVRFLKPGQKYYFSLAAARDCSSSSFSQEVSVFAMGGKAVMPPVSDQTASKAGQPSIEKQSSVSMPIQQGMGLNLHAVSGPNIGEVTLSWNHADSANDYHLVYGTSPGQHQYGALNIGNIQSFTVRYLNPGSAYYFALVPIFDNRPLYTSAEIKAWAKAMEVVVTSPANLGQAESTAPADKTGSADSTPTNQEDNNTEGNILEKIKDTPTDSAN